MRNAFALGCALAAAPTVVAQSVPPDLELTPVVTTGISSPLAVRNAGDGSGRLFIVGQGGRIWVLPNGANAVLATPFLQFTGTGGTLPPFGFASGGERGLLGLAFHPDFETNGYFFVDYTDGDGDTAIVRYTTLAGDPNRADPASATVLLRIDQDYSNHNGGDIHFGPDEDPGPAVKRYLYIAMGDGGSGGDPCNRAQTLRPAQLPANDGNDPDPDGCPADASFTGDGGDPDSRALLGKLLRIDVDGSTPNASDELCGVPTGATANYAIPPDNPFAGISGTAGNCDEIWAYGLRNPFRFSFDRLTGDLFVGDVGQGTQEEVDFEPASSPGGVNYGWDLCEGMLGTCPGAVRPILFYTSAENVQDNPGTCTSLTGGFRYRGDITPFFGTYVYADYCTGKIHFGVENGGTWSTSMWRDSVNFQYSSFGEDEAGELYVTELGAGRVLRFTSTQTGIIFSNGFE
jgi:glucose/arabinose dehydrogenase